MWNLKMEMENGYNSSILISRQMTCLRVSMSCSGEKIWTLKNFENWKPYILKWENDHNSAPGTLIKKVRPLYFLQLLKLKIIKWSHFFTKRLWCWVMAIFSFQYVRVSTFKVFQCPYFPTRSWHWNSEACHLSRN